MTDAPPPQDGAVSPIEQDLLRRLRGGDAAAFESLYETYYERLWRFAYGLVRTRATAQDVVQDVFLSLWTNRERLNIRTTLDGYLYAAVRHHALKFMRHDRVVQRELDEALSLHHSPAAAEAAVGVAERLEQEEISAALQHAIAGLSERHRAAILLRWKHGMRYEEMSKVLGISPQAARTLVLRIQATLKAIITRVR